MPLSVLGCSKSISRRKMVNRLDLEKVVVGQELAPIRRYMTQEKINKYVSAAEDYNPIHVDPEFGKSTSYGSTIAPGYQIIAYASEMMTRDFGEKWIRGGVMDVRLLRAVLPGDTLTIGGKILEKRKEEEGHLIKCDVWIRNQKNEEVITGYTLVRY